MSGHKTLTSETIEYVGITVPNQNTSYEILLNGHDTRIKLEALFLIRQCTTPEFSNGSKEQIGSEELKIRNYLKDLAFKQEVYTSYRGFKNIISNKPNKY